MIVFVAIGILAICGAFVTWNSPKTGGSAANGKAIICEIKHKLTPYTYSVEAHGFIFESNQVIEETFLLGFERVEIYSSEPHELRYDGDALWWYTGGSYSLVDDLYRHVGYVLDRQTLEISRYTYGYTDTYYPCELYRTHWQYRWAMRKNLKRLQSELDDKLSQNKI